VATLIFSVQVAPQPLLSYAASAERNDLVGLRTFRVQVCDRWYSKQRSQND
jgi:hypothetical protein